MLQEAYVTFPSHIFDDSLQIADTRELQLSSTFVNILYK